MVSPHGEEALRAVSNHEVSSPSFETRLTPLLRMRNSKKLRKTCASLSSTP
jgi:hypothetical protein